MGRYILNPAPTSYNRDCATMQKWVDEQIADEEAIERLEVNNPGLEIDNLEEFCAYFGFYKKNSHYFTEREKTLKIDYKKKADEELLQSILEKL